MGTFEREKPDSASHSIVIAEESLRDSRIDLVRLRELYPQMQVASIQNPQSFLHADICVVPLKMKDQKSYDYLWEHHEHTQVILVDRGLSVPKTADAMKQGVVDVLHKPLSTERLALAIERALRIRTSPGLKKHSYLWNIFKAMEKMNHTHDETRLLHIFMQTMLKETQSRGAILYRMMRDDLDPMFTLANEKTTAPIGRMDCVRFAAVMKKHAYGDLERYWREPRYGHLDSPFSFMDVGTIQDVLVIPIELEQGVLVACFVGPPETLQKRVELDVLASFGHHTGAALRGAQQYKKMSELVYIDDVTGLYNSRYLPLAIEQRVQQYERDGTTFAVLFIDLDRFKNINDTHGHLVGSDVLVQAGHVIRRSVRYDDAVFRYGGDEFVVILNSTDAQGSLGAAERIRQNLEHHHFQTMGVHLRLTASIGVACYPAHGLTMKTVVEQADKAMYEGKRKSRNVVLMLSEKSS